MDLVNFRESLFWNPSLVDSNNKYEFVFTKLIFSLNIFNQICFVKMNAETLVCLKTVPFLYFQKQKKTYLFHFTKRWISPRRVSLQVTFSTFQSILCSGVREIEWSLQSTTFYFFNQNVKIFILGEENGEPTKSFDFDIPLNISQSRDR